MAAAWARAKRALATSLCVSMPARQRAIEDAPPVVAAAAEAAAPSSVSEDKLESASVSVRRLTSFGSRSSQQVGIRYRFSFFFFLPCSSRFMWRAELFEPEMWKKCLLWRWISSGFWEKTPCKIPSKKDGGFGLVLVKDPR